MVLNGLWHPSFLRLQMHLASGRTLDLGEKTHIFRLAPHSE